MFKKLHKVEINKKDWISLVTVQICDHLQEMTFHWIAIVIIATCFTPSGTCQHTMQTWDFSDYPTTGESSPAPVNPSFTQNGKLAGIPGAPKTPTPQSAQPDCSVLQGKQATCDWMCNNCTRSSDITACGHANSWGLSFDDGPSPYTPALLDFLAANKLTVTFCVVGSNVMKYPAILLRAFREGHQICIHTWSHWSLTTLSNEVILAELEWTRMIIEQVTGASPVIWRPPYGDVDDRVRAVAAAAGMKHALLWNMDSNDWKTQGNPSALDISADFSAAAAKMGPAGIISLEHDLYNDTVQKGIPAITGLIQRGNIQLMSVAHCMGNVDMHANPSKDSVANGGNVINGTEKRAQPSGSLPNNNNAQITSISFVANLFSLLILNLSLSIW